MSIPAPAETKSEAVGPVDGPPMSLAARFDEWVTMLESSAVVTVVPIDSWFGVALFCIVVALVAGVFPPTRAFFELRPLPTLGASFLALGLNLATAILARRGILNGRARVLVFFAARGTLQWLSACFMAFSSPAGATVFASFLVLTASFHGYLFRTGVRYPFGAPVTVLGIAGSAWIYPSVDHFAIFVITGCTSIAGSLLVGTFALRADILHARSERLREAVAAQILNEGATETRRLSTAFLEVLAANHDVGNSLAAARINADLLASATNGGAERMPLDEVSAIASDISECLERVMRVFDEARRIGRGALGSHEAIDSVEIAPTIARVARDVAARFRKVSYHVDVAEVGAACARVRGGKVSFERILENILTNACEGDGETGASNVTLVARREPVGHVTITVCDDGPGFLPEMLACPIRGFQTTKRAGTGLGLYAAGHLMAASGGSLARENAPSGGAKVSVVLAEG